MQRTITPFGTPFETLESRTLMSVSPFNAAVAGDRLQIRIDFLRLNAHFYANSATLVADNRALRLDHLSANTTLQPLVAKFRSDVYSYGLTLRGDRLTEAGNVITAEQVVVGELKQIFADRKNPTALVADRAALVTDRAALQGAMVAGLTQRLADRQAMITALTADSEAIMTALPTSGASAKLTADVTQWLADKGDAMAKISSDLTKISADRTKLIADLNAENA